jgi:lambda family phage portal protein
MMGLISRLEKAKSPSRETRQYAAAKFSRLTASWNPTTSSADTELVSSLHALRNRSRQLIRDNSYAKRAKTIVINNVVGSGINMEPQVRNRQGNLVTPVNDAIEEAWCEWSRPENCHTGGKLSFADLERQTMGQIFEAGEVLIRKWYRPFGPMGFPFALELIEAERLADEFSKPAVATDMALYRMGVERDQFGRPVAFWLRQFHPGELRFPAGLEPNIYFRVPAPEMFHLYVCDRWPQTRGEPWLHCAARRLNDMDGYAEAEIVRARGVASIMGVITTPDEGPNDNPDPAGQPQFALEPGAVERLAPGETFEIQSANVPSANMDPFMRLMLREVAAGAGASYESLSRDYSQSNYSSSRLALLDDRDIWRVLQQFFIRTFREPLHREWLQQGVMSRALSAIDLADYGNSPSKYEAVSFKPRGWSWVDPTKEVDAYIKARRAGLMSVSQIVALTGGGVDLEDTWAEIAAETQDAKDKGLIFTTDPSQILEKSESDATAVAPPPAGGEPPAIDGEGDRKADQQLEIADGIVKALAHLIDGQRELSRRVDSLPAPVVNIAPQPVYVDTPDVKVNVTLPDSRKRELEIVERDEDGRATKVIERRAAA